MAKNKANKVQRQGRRVIPAIRRTGVRAKAAVQTTLGDLIAAAFDAVDGVGEVAKVIGSSEMAAATGKKIVFI
ncbi:MAG: hypothetical protein ACJ790_21790 [Myxococcaceae bacterium]